MPDLPVFFSPSRFLLPDVPFMIRQENQNVYVSRIVCILNRKFLEELRINVCSRKIETDVFVFQYQLFFSIEIKEKQYEIYVF